MIRECGFDDVVLRHDRVRELLSDRGFVDATEVTCFRAGRGRAAAVVERRQLGQFYCWVLDIDDYPLFAREVFQRLFEQGATTVTFSSHTAEAGEQFRAQYLGPLMGVGTTAAPIRWRLDRREWEKLA